MHTLNICLACCGTNPPNFAARNIFLIICWDFFLSLLMGKKTTVNSGRDGLGFGRGAACIDDKWSVLEKEFIEF